MPLPASIRCTTAPGGPAWAEPRRGYRSGPENLLVDALLPLAEAPADASAAILDLGAGAGSLGLITAHALRRAGYRTRLTGVERDPELAAFCAANYAACEGEAQLLREDLREWHGTAADVVLCNPPFFAPDHGRPSRNPSVRGATHALHGGVEAFLRCARNHLRPKGRILLLYPSDQLSEALALLPGLGLHPHVLLLLHARHTGRPYRAWCALGHDPPAASGMEIRIASTCTDR